jgi:hypothetical protein
MQLALNTASQGGEALIWFLPWLFTSFNINDLGS